MKGENTADVIAIFNSSTGLAGRTVECEDDNLIVAGFGPITAAQLLECDRLGQIDWSGDQLRQWVCQRELDGLVEAAATPTASDEFDQAGPKRRVFEGHTGRIELGVAGMLIIHTGSTAEPHFMPDKPWRIPLDAVSDVQLVPATARKKGWIQVCVRGASGSPQRPISTALRDPGSIAFAKRSERDFRELQDALKAHIVESWQRGIDPSVIEVESPPLLQDPEPSSGPISVVVAKAFQGPREGWHRLQLSRAATGKDSTAVLRRRKTPEEPTRVAPNFAERALTATVEIKAGRSLGTGFILSEEGLAVTARHVIDGTGSSGASVQVRLFANQPGERMTSAIVFFAHPSLDYALLWLDAPGPYPTLAVGEPKALRYTDVVFALGSPCGLSNTVSRGVISNPHAILQGIEYIQTDAAISEGNSGGPLIDEHGRVVGINLMGLASSLGDIDAAHFALPLDYLLDDVNDALRRGREKCIAGGLNESP